MLPVLLLVHVASSPGQTFGISAFYPAWIQDLGLTRWQIGLAYGLGTLAAAVPMTFVGMAMERWGGRAILTVVIVLFSGACWGISFAGNVVALGIGFFFLRLLGQGSMTLIASNTMAHWFDRRLGRVTGFSSLAISAAIFFIPAMNLALIADHGWRWTYRAWGVVLCAILLPPVLAVFRNRPEDVGQKPDGLRGAMQRSEPAGEVSGVTLAQAIRNPAYWIGVSCTVYWSMTITAIMLVLVDHFTDKQLSDTQAGVGYSVFAVALAGFHVLGGFLADFTPLNRMLAVSIAGLGVGTGVLGLMKTPVHGWSAMAMLGAAQGLFAAVNATIWVRYFGRRHLGKIRGTVTTAMVAGSSLGPLLAGWVRDLFGRYDQVFFGLGLLSLPLAVVALWARKPRQ